MLVGRTAAPRPEVSAGAVRASLEDQSAIGVPLGEQVGQAPPVALLVHGDAVVVAAGRARAARDRPRVSAPLGRQEAPAECSPLSAWPRPLLSVSSHPNQAILDRVGAH